VTGSRLMPNKQCFSYIMARTSYICTRPTCL